MAHQFTLKKDERLKSRKLIEKLFKQGRSFSIFPFRIIYFFAEVNISFLQSGFGVSGKVFKKAVDRNRVKRLMREAYRLQKNPLAYKLKTCKKYLAVFFIYNGNLIPEYKEVIEKISSALKKLEKITDESSVENT